MAASAAAAVLYAVVIGHNGAPSPSAPPLRFADDDAAGYARLLREAGARTTLLTAYDEDSRRLQADLPPDGPPTEAALYAALARIDEAIAQGGVPAELFVVYTGHGDVDHGEGFVMLDGARLTRRALRDQVLAPRRAARIHVIVDACKSYYLVFARGGERRRHAASFAGAPGVDLGPGGLPRVGFALSTSSDAESHEWEEVQGGVFSHEVRSALRGAGDADGDGRISYAELGAFVRSANLGIANPRYRPRFTVVPPLASGQGEGTAVLAWTGEEARARTLRLDAPRPGRVTVEDALGRRVLDANLAVPTALHLPLSPLYLWDRDNDREYALDLRPAVPDARPAPLALSSLEPRARRLARRGAREDAFSSLFGNLFGPEAVDAWRSRPPPDDDGPPREPRKAVAIGLAGGALGALVAAVGCSVGAASVRAGAGPSQEDRVGANGRIDTLNQAALGLYLAAGVTGAASAILGLWPRPKPRSQAAPPSALRLAPAPGPGQVGLAVAAWF